LIPGKLRNIFLVCSLQTGSDAYTSSFTIGNEGSLLGQTVWDVEFTIELYLVPKLRILEVPFQLPHKFYWYDTKVNKLPITRTVPFLI
jgi:hypothetical protein